MYKRIQSLRLDQQCFDTVDKTKTIIECDCCGILTTMYDKDVTFHTPLNYHYHHNNKECVKQFKDDLRYDEFVRKTD